MSTSRSLVGSSSSSRLPPLFSSFARCTRLRSPPERSFTFFCWSAPLKLNAAAVGARVHLALADHHDVLAAVGDLLPDACARRRARRGSGRRTTSATVSPTLSVAGVGLLLADDHAEERRLAGAVRADDADDAAARQVEVEVVDQQVVAVAPCAGPCASTTRSPRRGPGGIVISALAVALLGRLVLGQQLLVAREARLALGLARARRHAHPLELALERALARRLLLLLLREPLLLLLEPGRVVALPRDARAAVELEDPAGDVVEEVAVVGDRDDVPGILLQVALEPGDRLGVEVVGRLVEQQQVGLLRAGAGRARRGAARRPRASSTSASPGGRRSASIAISSVPVELPRVRGVDLVLQRLLLEHFVHLVVRVGSPSFMISSKRVSSARVSATASSTCCEHGLRRVELRLLRQVADARALAPGTPRRRSPCRRPAMMRSSVLLPAPFAPEHADLGARVERQPDALQDLLALGGDLAQVLHGEDELGHAGRLSPCGGPPRATDLCILTRRTSGS